MANAKNKTLTAKDNTPEEYDRYFETLRDLGYARVVDRTRRSIKLNFTSCSVFVGELLQSLAANLFSLSFIRILRPRKVK